MVSDLEAVIESSQFILNTFFSEAPLLRQALNSHFNDPEYLYCRYHYFTEVRLARVSAPAPWKRAGLKASRSRSSSEVEVFSASPRIFLDTSFAVPATTVTQIAAHIHKLAVWETICECGYMAGLQSNKPSKFHSHLPRPSSDHLSMHILRSSDRQSHHISEIIPEA